MSETRNDSRPKREVDMVFPVTLGIVVVVYLTGMICADRATTEAQSAAARQRRADMEEITRLHEQLRRCSCPATPPSP